MEDLRLKRLFVVYPGKQSYALGARVEVISIKRVPQLLAELG